MLLTTTLFPKKGVTYSLLVQEREASYHARRLFSSTTALVTLRFDNH